jgi:hypothetical protein
METADFFNFFFVFFVRGVRAWRLRIFLIFCFVFLSGVCAHGDCGGCRRTIISAFVRCIYVYIYICMYVCIYRRVRPTNRALIEP